MMAVDPVRRKDEGGQWETKTRISSNSIVSNGMEGSEDTLVTYRERF